jgi:hypothetical protein
MSLFTGFCSPLSGDMRGRIKKSLDDSPDFPDEESLREVFAGNTNAAEITSFLQKNLSLRVFDASILAGLLVAPIGNYILISHLIIRSRLDLNLSSHFSIALSICYFVFCMV